MVDEKERWGCRSGEEEADVDEMINFHCSTFTKINY